MPALIRLLGSVPGAGFSTIRVTVRGEPGDERDRLIELCRSVLADFELQPDVELAPAAGIDRATELIIGDTQVAHGLQPHRRRDVDRDGEARIARSVERLDEHVALGGVGQAVAGPGGPGGSRLQ
mgnify:CR=1 FL=1